jgi:hypothetical protein
VLIAAFWIGFLGVTAVVIVASRVRKLAPLSPIGAAPEAVVVRIAGTVATENGLRAPVSNRPCTCYWVAVMTKGRRRVRRTFQEVLELELVDPTGRASVPAERVHLEVSADLIHDTTPHELPERLRSKLAQWGVKLDKESSLQLCEGIVAQGDEVEVVGSGMRRPLPGDLGERGFRDAPATLLELRGAVHILGARRPIQIVERV